MASIVNHCSPSCFSLRRLPKGLASWVPRREITSTSRSRQHHHFLQPSCLHRNTKGLFFSNKNGLRIEIDNTLPDSYYSMHVRKFSSNSNSSNINNNSSKDEELVGSLTRLCSIRYAASRFDETRSVDHSVIRSILSITQSAPSSFNLQPFKIIVVQDANAKLSLSNAMIGFNQTKVIGAAFTVVFLSYKDPSTLTDKVIKLEKEKGNKPQQYLSILPSMINFLLQNNGILATSVKRVAAHLMSPLRAMPKIYVTNDAWAQKNSTFAAQNFMLACSAHGLVTAPMEGFDERRVCFELGVPDSDFTIPLVISAGYARKEDEALKNVPKARFPIEDVCFSNRFGDRFDVK